MDERLQAPQLADTPATKPPTDGEQALEDADASRSSALDAVDQTRENLAVPLIVNGEVVTPGDQARELRYRQEHGGRSSNETATGR